MSLLLLALLPVAAAVSAPATDRRLHDAFSQPLAVVGVSFEASRAGTAAVFSDAGMMSAVGVGLLGLAAVVRKTVGKSGK